MDRSWSSVVVAMIACGPVVAGDTSESSTTIVDGTADVTSVGTSTSSTSTSTDVTTSVPPPLTTSTTSETDTGTSGSTSSGCLEETGEAPIACGPQPDEGYLNVDFRQDRDVVSSDVDSACTVADAELGLLDCEGHPYVFSISSDAPLDLGIDVGDVVHLRGVRDYPFEGGGYQFVVLRDDVGQILAARYQPAGSDPPPIDVPSFFAPLEFDTVDLGCDPVRQGLPGCASFVVDGCPSDVTRLAVDFASGSESVRVWSDTFGELGPLRVFADASFREPVKGFDCFDVQPPYTHLAWAAVRSAD